MRCDYLIRIFDKNLIWCQAKLENMTSKKDVALKIKTSLNEKVSNQNIINKADMAQLPKKPYACNLCPKSFTLQAILKGHVILEHTGDTVFSRSPPSCLPFLP